jgi:hypothetical protein
LGTLLFGGASATASTQSLSFKVESGSSASLDLNANGDAGDQIVFDEVLSKHGRKTGTDRGMCTATFEANKYMCIVVFTLTGRGQIVVQGLTDFALKDPVMAITGGTGEFSGAAGWFDFTTQDPTHFTDNFHIER